MWVGWVSIRWGRDGLIRMIMWDVRNEDVLINIRESAVELISSDGHIVERVLNLMQWVADPLREWDTSQIYETSDWLSLAHTHHTHKQTLARTDTQQPTHPGTLTYTHPHTHHIRPYRNTLQNRHPPTQTHSHQHRQNTHTHTHKLLIDVHLILFCEGSTLSNWGQMSRQNYCFV